MITHFTKIITGNVGWAVGTYFHLQLDHSGNGCHLVSTSVNAANSSVPKWND